MIRFDTIAHQHGKQILFLDASAGINRGDKVGLVGPNGAGKTTLFRMIMKDEEPDLGQVSIDRDISIGYFSQDVGEMGGRTALLEALHGAGRVAKLGIELKQLEAGMADPDKADQMEQMIARFFEVQSEYDRLGGYALEANAREVMHGLGFSDAMIDNDVSKLSGGWKMRVALARILIMKPDAMLLDEPSNHLDLESIIWLETFLRGFEGALLMTSHDREFMNRIVDKIIEIDSGELRTYTGNLDFYEKQRAQKDSQQQAQFERQQAMLAKEEKFIARFKAQAAKAAQVQSRVKKLEKIDKVEPPKQRKIIEFEFPVPPRSGDKVAKVEGVHKAYGEKIIYKGFDFLVRRQERWCVMGVNGAGKSTLLKMIAGESQPDAGSVALGANVKLGYFAQHAMELLDPQASVWETLSNAFPKASIGSLRTLAGCFGFSDDTAWKLCKQLSGGEKARLVMAKLLYDPPNFLILDEPTNHLDMATKDMLVKALQGYEGTMLFVSHDRRFLAALSNRVLEIERDGVHVYPGTYSEYVARTGHEAPGVEQ